MTDLATENLIYPLNDRKLTESIMVEIGIIAIIREDIIRNTEINIMIKEDGMEMMDRELLFNIDTTFNALTRLCLITPLSMS